MAVQPVHARCKSAAAQQMSVAATNETAAKFSLSGLASTCQECSGCAITQSDRRYAIVYTNFNLPHQFSKLCWQRVPGTSGGHCHDLGKSARTDSVSSRAAQVRRLQDMRSSNRRKLAVERPEKTRGRATGENSQPPAARAPLRALSCELYCAPPRALPLLSSTEYPAVSSTVPRCELF